ncbi:MAG TPA: hypothetical protein VGM09_22450 [Bradyrhizobium sp.]
MPKNLLLAAITAILLAGCASQTVPLPMVHASDPTWALTPDHLPGGVLPQ